MVVSSFLGVAAVFVGLKATKTHCWRFCGVGTLLGGSLKRKPT